MNEMNWYQSLAKKCLLFLTPASTIAQRFESIKFSLNGCLPSTSSGSVTGFLTFHLAVGAMADGVVFYAAVSAGVFTNSQRCHFEMDLQT